uniref:Uncharacterized protein n=1 Tax=Arundo donax TaxID=35708 RepID=A0A0A9GMW5_ARUDO
MNKENSNSGFNGVLPIQKDQYNNDVWPMVISLCLNRLHLNLTDEALATYNWSSSSPDWTIC